MIVKIMSEFNAVKHSYNTDIPPCIIVSITGESDKLPDFNKFDINNPNKSKVLDIFEMHFEDIDKKYPGHKEPKQSDFKGLKAFIDRYRNDVEELIVHCHAGVSRSAGCASAICKYLNIKDFIWISDKYIPNKLVYKLCSNELGVPATNDEINTLSLLNSYALENEILW